MTRTKPKIFLVLVREGWSSKITNCPWMFQYTPKGYKTALHCHETLKKLFPKETYNMKAFTFNGGAETEIPIDISVLTK
jgi:hypothetical protein